MRYVRVYIYVQCHLGGKRGNPWTKHQTDFMLIIIILVFNKADLLVGGPGQKKEQIFAHLARNARPSVLISVLSGWGLERLAATIQKALEPGASEEE